MHSRKAYLLKCIAAPISEHPSAVNVLKRAKHSRSLTESAFMLIFPHSDIEWPEKRLS